ncbi:MAG TPA: hypothetical protein VL095_13320 [Flavisolibacter sp.]|nr:hypothetical protein [Flavisolibacter sp.]
MILREEILKEHSKPQALKIAGYACESRKNFKELMKCFLDDEYMLAQRAAWSVGWAARQKPQMIQPHIKDLVSVLYKKNVHDAVIRNSVRVLQEIEIPEKFHGEVMDACFQFLEEPSTPVAIKVFSLTTLFNLSKRYPEIKPELKLIIEDNLEHETPAFRARVKRVLPKL